MTSDYSMPATDLRHLQETLLTAAMIGQRLPGTAQPLIVPGFSRLVHQQRIYLLDEHLAPGLAIDKLPRPARAVSEDDLVAEVRASGTPVTFLRFDAPEMDRATIRLTLETQVASINSPLRITGVGGVQCAFREIDHRWTAIGEAIMFSP